MRQNGSPFIIPSSCSEVENGKAVRAEVQQVQQQMMDKLHGDIALQIKQLNERILHELHQLRDSQQSNFLQLKNELDALGGNVSQELQQQAHNHAQSFNKLPKGFRPDPGILLAAAPGAAGGGPGGTPDGQRTNSKERGNSKEKAQGTPTQEQMRNQRFTKYGPGAIAAPEFEEEEDGFGMGGASFGKPRGEFKGRPNLFAFLQAKKWDSEAALFPDDKKHQVAHVEPPLGTKYKNFIMSQTFDLLIGVVIVANSLTMGLELEYEGQQTSDAIGIARDPGNWPVAAEAFNLLQHVFAIIFAVELVLRLSVMGCSYFKYTLNWMDFMLVALSMLELYIFQMLAMSLPENMDLLRLLRVFKIVRVLRILRVLRIFDQLRTLVTSIACSMPSLGWSIVLLAIIMLIGAIFITTSLQGWLRDDTQEEETRTQVYTFFGTFTRSIISLFEMTLAPGTWGRCGRVVIFGVDRAYTLFFMGYLMFVSFAMIRVISAIFLKETLNAAAKDADVVMAEENKNPKYVQQMNKVFDEMDKDGDGNITLNELHESLKNIEVIRQLDQLGIGVHEMLGLFTLMDDGDDEISFAEFLSGTMRLKNANKGVDLVTLLYENKKLLAKVLGVSSRLDKLRDYLGDATDFEEEP